MTPQAIAWPEITVGGRKFTLRFSYAAQYQLTRWGRTLADATAIEIAAACAGSFDAAGKWHSEGFEKPIHFADLMDTGDETAVIDGVLAAIKNRYPEVAVSARPTPETVSATSSDGSTSGPSGPAAVASD
jgi:hypothetical protein